MSSAQPAAATATSRVGRRRWFGLFFLALGVAMIIVDATIVNVAVASIIRDLGVTSTGAQWVQEAYTLVFAALLCVHGRERARRPQGDRDRAEITGYVCGRILPKWHAGP